ncbi:hypothetical protein [Thermovenabulum gondwanense]|uniref:Uncharacterized protein n=1 Tax=Thermovenabulum gondwanense TaxID=520767 RepID=A0A162MYI7_9FIRM|nr:hypothetical protein [Thermovenabulum gondwanense]KYO68558.1 hypothetical protein ATZ99_00670 [Thermovenabulum gondwanense]
MKPKDELNFNNLIKNYNYLRKVKEATEDYLDKKKVNKLIALLREAISKRKLSLEVWELDKFRDNYFGYKGVIGAFKVRKVNMTYYLIFVPWNNDERISLVVYLNDSKLPIFGRFNCKIIGKNSFFYYNYYSVKRDGKNALRKELFYKKYGEGYALIKLPRKVEEVDLFIQELVYLSDVIDEINREV